MNMNILTASSEKFFKYMMVMLTSLFHSNAGDTFDLYFMHKGLSEDMIQSLESLTDAHNSRLHSIIVDADLFAGFPTRMGGPVEAYFRLSMMEYLPHDLERILYLDSDMIVDKPIRKFYEADFEGNSLVACVDFGINYLMEPFTVKHGVSRDYPYFNSGVMLLNMGKFRELGIGMPYFRRVLENLTSDLVLGDQDLLNIVFHDKVKLLDFAKFNFQPLDLIHNKPYKVDPQTSDDPEFASIVHYTGYKPWDQWIVNPGSEMDELWWRYARMTPACKQMESDFKQSVFKRMTLYQQYFFSVSKYLANRVKGKSFGAFLCEKGYRTIALYGSNYFAEILYTDLAGSGVSISYIMDTYDRRKFCGMRVHAPSELKTLDPVDAIIVTAFFYYGEIAAGLDTEIPVVSLEKLIDQLDREEN